MGQDYRLWAVTMGTALHILEEESMDWKGWAEETFGMEVSWSDFYVTNAALVVAAICGAEMGWKAPTLSLSVPALTVINALAFHLGPALRQRRYNPGLLTAVAVYLPAAYWAYDGAKRDGVLSRPVALASFLAGSAFMAFPFTLARLKHGRSSRG